LHRRLGEKTPQVRRGMFRLLCLNNVTKTDIYSERVEQVFLSSPASCGRDRKAFLPPFKPQEGLEKRFYPHSKPNEGLEKRFYPYLKPNGGLEKRFCPYLKPNGGLEKCFYPYSKLNGRLEKRFYPYSKLNEGLEKRFCHCLNLDSLDLRIYMIGFSEKEFFHTNSKEKLK
jgi:hypothetical protein